jgi:EmrB/QacA subfamily drug resistance transporter
MSSTHVSGDAVSDRTAQATRDARAGTLKGQRAALALLAAAQFMSVLDASIITVALPSIQSDLSLSMSSLSWVVNAYVLTFGGFLLLAGRLADLSGRRSVLMLGWGLFGAASLAAGLSGNGGTLIAARAVQGLGAALMVPAALALLTTIFSGRSLAAAFGVWGAASGGAGAVGVLLGGVLTDAVGWEWVFFINVPVTLVGAIAAPALLPEARLPRTSYDIAGGLSVTAGLALLVYALVETESNGWGSTATLALIAGAFSLIALFVATEARVEHPLVRLGFFRNPTVSYANVVGVLFGASVLVPLFFFSTLYLQRILSYSPQEAGLAYLPMAAASFLGAGIASRVMSRTGPWPVLIAALLAGTLGMFGLARASANGSYVGDVLGPFVLLGLGLGPVITALTAAATGRAAEQEAGLASGLINTTQQLGGAIGLAVLVSLAGRRAEAAAATGGGPPSEQPAALVEGFQLAFYLGGAISAAAIAFAALGMWAGRRTARIAPTPDSGRVRTDMGKRGMR